VNERFVFPKTVPHNNRAPVITESTTRDIFYFRGRAKIKIKKGKKSTATTRREFTTFSSRVKRTENPLLIQKLPFPPSLYKGADSF
jgi:hypothetical protein